jgi:circadian clock protein KaiC
MMNPPKNSLQKTPTGIEGLDEITNGGLPTGRTTLIRGSAGSGKTSLAMTFLKTACERGGSALYLGFEESIDQVFRNMSSIGLDLRPLVEKVLLHFHTVRLSSLGLEAHLAFIHRVIKRVGPKAIVMDPITAFFSSPDTGATKSMLTRLVDFLKTKQITAMLTHLSSVGGRLAKTDENVSSIMGTWLLLRDVEHKGARNSVLYFLKSRDMAHSHEMRNLILTDDGFLLGESCTMGLSSAPRHAEQAIR